MQHGSNKLKELALFFAKKSEDDVNFGRTKLQKLFFTADFIAYATFGASITGQRYVKRDHGPCVDGWPQILDEMKNEGIAAEQTRGLFGYPQKRLIALREPHLADFSGDEINIAQYSIDIHGNRNATEVSDWSHDYIGWKLAYDGEEIPYETVFVTPRKLSSREIEFGRELNATIAV